MNTDTQFAGTRKPAVLMSIAALSLAMSFGNASACACCETYAVVNVASWDVLNIRSGPGVQFDIVGSFAHNDRCIVLHPRDRTMQRVGNWVRLPDGGWVNVRYLEYRHDG